MASIINADKAMRPAFLSAAIAACCAFMPAQAGVFLQYDGSLRGSAPPWYLGRAVMSGKLFQDVAIGQQRFVTADDFEYLDITLMLLRDNIPNGLFPAYRFTKADLAQFSGTVTGWYDTNVVFIADHGAWSDAKVATGFQSALLNDAYLNVPIRIKSSQNAFDFTNEAGQRLALTHMSPAPEPASWAMLLTGFGLVGMGLRAASRKRDLYSRHCS